MSAYASISLFIGGAALALAWPFIVIEARLRARDRREKDKH